MPRHESPASGDNASKRVSSKAGKQRLFFGILIPLLTVFTLSLAALTGFILRSIPLTILVHETFLRKFSPAKRVIDHSLDFLYLGPRPPEELPKYGLNISHNDRKEIDATIALSHSSYLTDEMKIWADAVFTADGEQFPVEIRLRGLGSNHWSRTKKSWRIRFPEDRPFHGMHSIDLILPGDRMWFATLLNDYRARKLGLLTPQKEFVQVFLDGGPPLLYIAVEGWEKEMLERQGMPGDVNVFHPETQGFSYDGFISPAYWEKYVYSPYTPPDSFEEIDLLLQIGQSGAHLRPQYPAIVETILDTNQFSAWYVLSLLAGNHHSHDDNIRLVFDSTRGRFIPIPWDINFSEYHSLRVVSGNSLWKEVFLVPKFRLAAFRRLWAYASNPEEVNSDLLKANRLRALIERAAYRDPLKFRSNREVRHTLNMISAWMVGNLQAIVRELQETTVTVRTLRSGEDSKVLAEWEVILHGTAPVLLTEIILQGKNVPPDPPANLRVLRDDGNRHPGREDVMLPIESVHSETGGLRLSIAQGDDFAFWPPETDIGREQENGRQEALVFLVTNVPFSSDAFSVRQLRFCNTVTGECVDQVATSKKLDANQHTAQQPPSPQQILLNEPERTLDGRSSGTGNAVAE